jgi:hypothetical protein
MKKKSREHKPNLIEILEELRLKLREIDQKLDHLIQTNRKFYFTSDFSHSNNREFNH